MQSRQMSLVEAVVNVVVGFLLGLLTQIRDLPVVRTLRISRRQPADQQYLHGRVGREEFLVAPAVRSGARAS